MASYMHYQTASSPRLHRRLDAQSDQVSAGPSNSSAQPELPSEPLTPGKLPAEARAPVKVPRIGLESAYKPPALRIASDPELGRKGSPRLSNGSGPERGSAGNGGKGGGTKAAGSSRPSHPSTDRSPRAEDQHASSPASARNSLLPRGRSTPGLEGRRLRAASAAHATERYTERHEPIGFGAEAATGGVWGRKSRSSAYRRRCSCVGFGTAPKAVSFVHVADGERPEIRVDGGGGLPETVPRASHLSHVSVASFQSFSSALPCDGTVPRPVFLQRTRSFQRWYQRRSSGDRSADFRRGTASARCDVHFDSPRRSSVSASVGRSSKQAATTRLSNDSQHLQFMVKLFGRTAREGAASAMSSRRTCMLHPLSRKRQIWEALVALLIFWSSVEIPFTIAFIGSRTDSFSFADVIDMFMMVDIFLTFFTGYVDSDDVITMDRSQVACRYLRGWLVVDTISSVPIDRIIKSACDSSSCSISPEAAQLFRLLRLLRLPKFFRYLNRWDEYLISSIEYTRLTRLILVLFLFIHINGCIQFIVPLMHSPPFPEESWVHYEPLESALPIDQSPTAKTAAICYMHSIFTALSQMLSVGYGLKTSELNLEIFVMLLSCASGAFVYAVVVAFMCNSLSSTDYPSKLFGNTLEVLNEFMRVHSLPKPLRTQLRLHLESRFPNKRMFSQTSIFSVLPYPMVNEIRRVQCEGLFARVPIFNDADPAFLSAMVSVLRPAVALPGDWLAREGEIQQYTVFIEAGLVAVLVEGTEVAELGDGSYLGEIWALGAKRAEDAHNPESYDALPYLPKTHGRATASVRCKDVCHLYVCPVREFEQILNKFPKVRSAMLVVARLRLMRSCLESTPNTPTPRRRTSKLWQTMHMLTNEDLDEFSRYQADHYVKARRASSGPVQQNSCGAEAPLAACTTAAANVAAATAAAALDPQTPKKLIGLAKQVGSGVSTGVTRFVQKCPMVAERASMEKTVSEGNSRSSDSSSHRTTTKASRSLSSRARSSLQKVTEAEESKTSESKTSSSKTSNSSKFVGGSTASIGEAEDSA